MNTWLTRGSGVKEDEIFYHFDLLTREWYIHGFVGWDKLFPKAMLYKNSIIVIGNSVEELLIFRCLEQLWASVKCTKIDLYVSSAAIYKDSLFAFGRNISHGPQLWEIDLSKIRRNSYNMLHWKQVITTGPIPPSRSANTQTVVADFMYILGGGYGMQSFYDLYELDLKAWHWRKIDSTVKIKRHCAVGNENALLVVGQHANFGKNTQVFEFIFRPKTTLLNMLDHFIDVHFNLL